MGEILHFTEDKLNKLFKDVSIRINNFIINVEGNKKLNNVCHMKNQLVHILYAIEWEAKTLQTETGKDLQHIIKSSKRLTILLDDLSKRHIKIGTEYAKDIRYLIQKIKGAS